jgi:DNA-binding MarR family transcriptional regulator
VKGYIERRKLPHNAKNVYVYLTPAGRDLQVQLVPLAEEVNRIAIDRTAHRASHPSTSTEDSNAQRHGVKLAAGEAFECSRSFT